MTERLNWTEWLPKQLWWAYVSKGWESTKEAWMMCRTHQVRKAEKEPNSIQKNIKKQAPFSSKSPTYSLKAKRKAKLGPLQLPIAEQMFTADKEQNKSFAVLFSNKMVFKQKVSSMAKRKLTYWVTYQRTDHLLSHSHTPGTAQSLEFLQTLEKTTTRSLPAWKLHAGDMNTEGKPEASLIQAHRTSKVSKKVIYHSSWQLWNVEDSLYWQSYQISLQCLRDDKETVMNHLTELETPETNKLDAKTLKGFIG